jgi:hypothetical protein
MLTAEEGSPVKLKSLSVMILLVLGCSFAAAQTFGFESVDHSLYCNYEQLSHASKFGADVWQGIDNLSMCTGRGGSTYTATLVGIGGGLTKAQNPARFPVKGVVLADYIYDAFSGVYTGAQYFVVSALKCSSKKYGWIGLTTISGVYFSDNYGYLSCQIPGVRGAVATRGPSTGGYPKVLGRE